MPTSSPDDAFRDHDARIRDYEARSSAAQARAAQAYSRLLYLAETRDSGQIPRIARFLAATYNSATFHWDPFDLRSLDVEISDDMLSCLDALRWGKADLYTLVPQGEKRARASCHPGMGPAPGRRCKLVYAFQTSTEPFCLIRATKRHDYPFDILLASARIPSTGRPYPAAAAT